MSSFFLKVSDVIGQKELSSLSLLLVPAKS